MGRWWSISRTLPLAITGLLLAVVGAFLALTHAEVRSTRLSAEEDRLLASVQQVAATVSEGATSGRISTERLAGSPLVVRYLATTDPAERERLAAVLRALPALDPDSEPRAIEIWSADGELLLEVGGTAGAPPSQATIPSPPEPGVNPLVAVGDRIYTRMAAPVRRRPTGSASEGERLGLLAIRQELAGGRRPRLVASLIGPGTTVLFGNRDGELWTDLERPLPGPELPARWDGAPIRTGTGEGEVLMAMAPIEGTPWTVWASTSVDAAMAPTAGLAGRLLGVGLALVVLGALAAWLLSRTITRPLGRLALASSAVAEGDYASRVDTDGPDEIARLAHAFNLMAAQVGNARHRLERRVAERTAELQEANEELAEAQERLVRREKLAMLGQLASGVGHELRNPLGVMTNAVYYLESVLTDVPERVSEYLDILKTQIGLSEKIIRDLLDMSRVQNPEVEPLEPAALVRSQLERAELPDHIDLEVDIPPTLPRALADRTQMGQVLLNLLTNAAQAIPDGGPGRIRIRGTHGEDGTVRLEVADDGIGMPPEVEARVFEPLFTTRARGIGLGLAVSKLLVERNGGELEVRSEPGAGSTFTLILPSVEEPAGE